VLFRSCLPLMAIVLGMILGACAKMFPWPLAIGASFVGRALYGAICGLFSTFLYSRIKVFLKKDAGTTTDTADTDPIPPPPEPDKAEAKEQPKTNTP
jgi:hypothetical protein